MPPTDSLDDLGDSADAKLAAPLAELSQKVPPVVDSAVALAEAAAALAAGSGPVAVDAERAGSYRYAHRAYLIQLRRAGAGTFLIDPTAFADLAPLLAALEETEWILHSASQDLPCLAEVGMVPSSIFDTEIAARLLGKPRVGLAALVESELGIGLAKEHSAADWSRRPLPEPWLRYAALDVELLIDLRDVMNRQLEAARRDLWAWEEFAHVLAVPPKPPRPDPWRRTSGIHRARNCRQLAVVRELWQERDRLARQSDRAPHRIIGDAALMSAALASPASEADLAALPEFAGRGPQRRIRVWWAAVERAAKLPESALPELILRADGPPPPRSWPERDAVAAQRLTASRSFLTGLAEAVGIVAECVVSPDVIRRICWEPPAVTDTEAVAMELQRQGVRGWQINLISAGLASALANPNDVATDGPEG